MSTFALQIVTPDGEFFDGEAEKLILRSIAGDVCILPRHTDYATAVATGVVRVTMDGKVRRAACSGGMLTVAKNHVRLVAVTFEWQEDIDRPRAQRALERAEAAVESAKTENELTVAKAKLGRALVRVRITE